MPRVLRYALVSIREIVMTAGPFAVLAVGVLVLAYWWMNPTPPRRVTLATGPERSAGETFGNAYKASLARYGITLELLPTAGSAENLARLADPVASVDFGFVQGGTRGADEAGTHGLVSLGSLFYEPVWIFYREAALPPPERPAAGARPARTPPPRLRQLAQMRGWTVNVGTEGSGVPRLFARLMEANRMDADAVSTRTLEPTPAVVELLDGRLDALVFASAPESPLVQMLLQTPGIGTFEFAQAEAYARRFEFLSRVALPRGIVDLGRDIPPRELPLVATTTTLVAREGTHPALLQLMMQAAADVHRAPGWFQRAGQFPSADASEIPVSDVTRRFLRDGRPFLQRYLPFWLANLIERMWLVLAAIVAVLIPLSRVVPPIYTFRVRRRVFRWYAKLRSIEDEIATLGTPEGADRERLSKALDELDAHAERITVPLSYTDELYALRGHISMVRARLG